MLDPTKELFVLAASVGMSHIIVDSYFMHWMRLLFQKAGTVGDYFIHCFQCTGFWCGLMIGFAVERDLMWAFIMGLSSSINSVVVKQLLLKWRGESND